VASMVLTMSLFHDKHIELLVSRRRPTKLVTSLAANRLLVTSLAANRLRLAAQASRSERSVRISRIGRQLSSGPSSASSSSAKEGRARDARWKPPEGLTMEEVSVSRATSGSAVERKAISTIKSAMARAHTHEDATAYPSIMVLYLCRSTFLGKSGETLADEVRAARQAGIPIVLVHRVQSCPFGWIMETTPRDLVEGGLYKTIAIDLLDITDCHLPVSSALFQQAIGAVEAKSSSANTPRRRYSIRPRFTRPRGMTVTPKEGAPSPQRPRSSLASQFGALAQKAKCKKQPASAVEAAAASDVSVIGT